jgi:hypothetical protein
VKVRLSRRLQIAANVGILTKIRALLLVVYLKSTNQHPANLQPDRYSDQIKNGHYVELPSLIVI